MLELSRLSRKGKIFILVGLILSVWLPFWLWHSSWFGRALSDPELQAYLTDAEKPRHIQHALSQISQRMQQRDPEVRRFYPQVIELASDLHPQIRLMAAWVMGQDSTYADFQPALRGLLEDPHPMVRRNAALALIPFGDSSGKEEILAMLREFTLYSPSEGRIRFLLKPGEWANVEGAVAVLEGEEGTRQAVRTAVPGPVKSLLVEEGARVKKGDPLLTLGIDPAQAWEALRALALVGEPEDLNLMEEILQNPALEQVWPQAELTMRALRRRGETSHQ